MAKDLENVDLSIDSTINNMQNISFGDFWKGEASNNQTNILGNIVNQMKQVRENIQMFGSKIAELGTYRDLLETIQQKETQLGSMEKYIIRRDEKGNEYQEQNPEYFKLANEISQLRQQAEVQKAGLQAYFDNVIPFYNRKITRVKYQGPNSIDYKNIDDVINFFYTNQPHLRIIAGTPHPTSQHGLYMVYESLGGKEYVYDRLMTAINSAGNSNRQKAINAVTELFTLTTAAGVKLPYINKGAGSDGSFVTTDCVATGVDCNAFVCWAVDKGVPNGFQWRPCAGNNGLTNVGKNIDFAEWSKGKPGDILSQGGTHQHSVFVLKNLPEENSFIIAQASGQVAGITLTKASYQDLRNGGMVLRDMDAVYTGEDQESRLNFAQNKTHPKYSEFNTDLHADVVKEPVYES